MMGFGYLSMALVYLKAILEIMLYISAIVVAFKAVQALNIYIYRNPRWHLGAKPYDYQTNTAKNDYEANGYQA